MASRSGRRGEFSPESKELMKSNVDIDKSTAEHEASAEKPRKRLQPRVTSKSPSAIPEIDGSVTTPAKQCTPADPAKSPATVFGLPDLEVGCRICRRDSDYANMLLCESCNDEYHTYCLNPPLQSVPEGDFICDKCKRLNAVIDDGLDFLVSVLPPSFTSRFGEIVWASGGVGFGWWPACIYDPRLTVGGARQLARKNLGKRHLIYFFECNITPFAVLGDNRLTKWEDGFIEEYDLGKVAKSGGKKRFTHFERAVQLAQLENGRPLEMRMDWNHQQAFPLTKVAKQKPTKSPQSQKPQKKQKQSPALKRPPAVLLPQDAVVDRRNLNQAVNSLINRGAANAIEPRKKLNMAVSSPINKGDANAIESQEDGILVCKILRRLPAGLTCNAASEALEFSTNVGFVTLPSRQKTTFAAIRHAMESGLDEDMLLSEKEGGSGWKFYIPNLGPMSVKQEATIGPALEFLKSTTGDELLGNGTAINPLKVVIIDL